MAGKAKARARRQAGGRASQAASPPGGGADLSADQAPPLPPPSGSTLQPASSHPPADDEPCASGAAPRDVVPTACAEWRLCVFNDEAPASLTHAFLADTLAAAALAATPDGEEPPHDAQLARPDAALAEFWDRLPPDRRAKLLRVTRRELFERLRAHACSRCVSFMQLRFEELQQ